MLERQHEISETAFLALDLRGSQLVGADESGTAWCLGMDLVVHLHGPRDAFYRVLDFFKEPVVETLDERDARIYALVKAGLTQHPEYELRRGFWLLSKDEAVENTGLKSACCCAIGAALLSRSILSLDDVVEAWYALQRKRNFGYMTSVSLFSVLFNVSLAYAQGISNGFEVRPSWELDYDDDDHARGYALGRRIFQELRGVYEECEEERRRHDQA